MSLAEGWEERLQSMRARLEADADEANAALAAAEVRGRQWAIDTLRSAAENFADAAADYLEEWAP